MTLSREQVEWAYRLFLGRDPENDTVIEAKRKLPDEKALSQVFFTSNEFRRRLAAFDYHPSQDKPPVVIHLHIPKTAGSSFNRILADNFQGKSCFSWHGDGIKTFREMPKRQRLNIDLLFGHATYGIHRFLRDSYINLFVLRDPKPRVYSFYKYVEATEDHPSHKSIAEEGMSFGDFLDASTERPQFRWDIDNNQMLRIAGIRDFSSELEIDYTAEFQRACRHAFSEACEFGLTEEFGAYLQRLKARGILTDICEQRLNMTNSSDSFQEAMQALTRRQHELLDSYTVWDQKFYSICRSYLDSLSSPGH